MRPFTTRRGAAAVINIMAAIVSLSAVFCAAEEPKKPAPPAGDAKADASAKDDKTWRSLFDGKTLGDWRRTDFGGGGDAEIEDGALVIGFGERLSGVTWNGPAIPKNNYEIALDAKRVNGVDIFCGVTFPVRDNFVSLIVGGWGGTVVGISNLNDNAAIDNETTRVIGFKSNQWYKIKIRVTDERIEAWIDEDPVVDVETKDKKLSVRDEIAAAKPFGVSTFQTTAALRNIRVRELTPEEIKAAKEDEKK